MNEFWYKKVDQLFKWYNPDYLFKKSTFSVQDFCGFSFVHSLCQMKAGFDPNHREFSLEQRDVTAVHHVFQLHRKSKTYLTSSKIFPIVFFLVPDRMKQNFLCFNHFYDDPPETSFSSESSRKQS